MLLAFAWQCLILLANTVYQTVYLAENALIFIDTFGDLSELKEELGMRVLHGTLQSAISD